MNCNYPTLLPRKLRKLLYGRYFIGIIILWFLGIQMVGCSPKKTLLYHHDGLNSYEKQAEKDNLRIAVKTLKNEEEQEKCFGIVLTDIGILPVHVMARNESASNRFLIRDDQILLQNKTTHNFLPKAVLSDAADDSQLQGAKTGTAAAGMVLLSLPLIFTSIGLGCASEKAKRIQDSIFDNTLFTKCIFPGKTVSGFAYFKVSDSKIDFSESNSLVKRLLLTIQAKDEDTEKTYDFQFDLS